MTGLTNSNAMAQKPQSLYHTLHPSWLAPLAPVEPIINELEVRLRANAKQGQYFLPLGYQILRAFSYPFEDIKVLIVGQDPYPTPGHPIGLSFAVAPGVQPPRSLENIYRELVNDVGCPRPQTGDLTPWCKQGVMLLNRVLTVAPNAAGSHRGWGWEKVTDQAISALAKRSKPLVAILWGRQAQELKPLLDNAMIIESAHPSPLSASRGFFGSRPFSRTNSYLEQAGLEPINWSL